MNLIKTLQIVGRSIASQSLVRRILVGRLFVRQLFKPRGQLALILALACFGWQGRSLSLCSAQDSPSNGNSIQTPSNGDAPGGASFADFDSLIELIQTTIAPDSWEALGGNSTISPYTQGIFVDPNGVVVGIEPQSGPAATLTSLQTMLEPTADQQSVKNWRSPSDRRCVSLTSLANHLDRQLAEGQPFAPETLYLAGLSTIDRIVLTGHDVRLYGRVGGIVDVAAMPIDRTTGAAPIELASLVEAFRCVTTHSVIGCTIDPTQQGLANAAAVGDDLANGKIAFGVVDVAVKQALGEQRVGVFGLRSTTPLAYRMIAVDRHMKQLALGEFDMPNGVPNYFDAIKQNIALGVPDDLLLRLWLTANPIKVRCDANYRVFEMSGRPIRLASENQVAIDDGTRGPIRRDPASESFVESFNDHWAAIREMYPAYGSIESLFSAAAIGKILYEYGDDFAKDVVDHIAQVRPHDDVVLRTPQSVASIAATDTIRHGRTRHRLLIASGGVSLAADSMLRSEPTIYPNLADDLASHSHAAPRATADRPVVWWWDLAK